jgi:hypothetical protein
MEHWDQGFLNLYRNKKGSEIAGGLQMDQALGLSSCLPTPALSRLAYYLCWLGTDFLDYSDLRTNHTLWISAFWLALERNILTCSIRESWSYLVDWLQGDPYQALIVSSQLSCTQLQEFTQVSPSHAKSDTHCFWNDSPKAFLCFLKAVHTCRSEC